MLGELEDSPILTIPGVKNQVDKSNHLVLDPTIRRVVIWVKWSTLFLLVLFGVWSGYTVIRRRSNAMALELIGALLFLGREAIFYRESYDFLFQDMNRISWYLDNGYNQFAISYIWNHRILPAYFILLAMFSCIYLARERS